VRLIVLGRRGESAETTQRDLGRNVERVVRALHRPILTVTEGFRSPSASCSPSMAVRDAPRRRDGGGEPAVSRPAGPAVHVRQAPAATRARSSTGPRRSCRPAGLKVEAELVPGDAETVIAGTRERDIDLLIMGAFGHSPAAQPAVRVQDRRPAALATIPTLLLR
jgi:hypothetical protein